MEALDYIFTWSEVKAELLADTNISELPIGCSACGLRLDTTPYTIHDPVILYCGHIYHGSCVTRIRGERLRLGKQLRCGACKVSEQLPRCLCPAFARILPQNKEQAVAFPQTKEEGGRLGVECRLHQTMQCLRRLAIAAGVACRAGSGDVIYATDEETTCFWSTSGSCISPMDNTFLPQNKERIRRVDEFVQQEQMNLTTTMAGTWIDYGPGDPQAAFSCGKVTSRPAGYCENCLRWECVNARKD
ncbi:hypothetical protein G7046_g8393 [Stylonectria norvegica]|nr:hypothetical protein G7046_g8393 [Stylonectria norvegica]